MNYKRISRLSALLLLISLITFPNSFSSATILGESEFPAEEEDMFVWETVNATESMYEDVEFIRFTVTEIYNETFNSQNFLFMNYTLEFYQRAHYDKEYENSFYMAYNKTLNFLNWSEEGFFRGNLFLFPTPVNYTLIGEAVKSAGFLNYSINGEKLTLDDGNNTKIELTINSSGISTIIEKITNTTTIYRWELNEEEIIIKVPFGNNYLLITIVSIISLVVLTKKKITNFRKQ